MGKAPPVATAALPVARAAGGKIREALSDSSEKPRLIESVARRGTGNLLKAFPATNRLHAWRARPLMGRSPTLDFQDLSRHEHAYARHDPRRYDGGA
jgi:hypothetical protein